MIVFVSGLTFKGYVENPEPIRQEDRACPHCGQRLSRHGFYRRRVRHAGGEDRVPIFRLRCRPCKLTVTLLPDFLRPHQLYLVEVQEEATGAYLTKPASFRKTAVQVSGATVPTGVSVTDALLHQVRTMPSFQQIFGWVQQFAARASRLCTELLAWSLRLQPDHDVLHQVATDTDAIGAKGKSEEKRSQLRAGVLLIALVQAIPALDAAHQGWLRALGAFVRQVLGRIPGPGPPLPHSSGREVLPDRP